MSTRRFLAAALQMCATDDMAANLAVCKQLAARAKAAGVSLLLLPENFAFLGEEEEHKFGVAEVVEPADPGPVLRALTEMAVKHGMWVIGGGMPEILDDERYLPRADLERTANTSVVISPAGELVARYRKIHLFEVNIPGRAVLSESGATVAGEDVVVADTGVGRIGLSICYDLRFPELYRELVVGRGAEIVTVPAAFTAYTGAAHWHTLLRARAIENQCYVMAAGQSGRHNAKRQSYGHSLIVDPWGTILAEAEEQEGLAVAEIDLDALAARRQQMPCLEHQVLLRRR